MSLRQLSCITNHHHSSSSSSRWKASSIGPTSTAIAAAAAAGSSLGGMDPASAAAAGGVAGRTLAGSAFADGLLAGVALAAGDGSTQYYHLQCAAGRLHGQTSLPLPGAAGVAIAGGGGLQHESSQHYHEQQQESGASAGGGGGGGHNRPGLLPVARGPLAYFYQQEKQLSLLAGAAGDDLGDQRPVGGKGAKGSGGSSSTAAAAAAQGGAESGSSASNKAVAVVSEPPLDLLLVWQVESQTNGQLSKDLLCGVSSGVSEKVITAHATQAVRVGLLPFYDLCAAQRLNPVRMLLEGPAQGLVRHDFRGASVCVVPLRLRLRNCGAVGVEVVVKAGVGWEAQDCSHAWFAWKSAAGAKVVGLLGAESPPPPASPAAAGSPLPAAAATGASFGGAGGGGLEVGGGKGFGPGSITPPRAQTPPRRVEGKDGAGVARSAPVQAGLTPSPDHVWCGVTYAPLELPAGHGEEVTVLEVAVFRPGVYVLDDYVVEWACVAEGGGGGRSLKGNKLGTPYVLRVEAA